MKEPRRKTKKKDNSFPSLSSVEMKSSSEEAALLKIKQNVFDSLNNTELENSIDKWLKENKFETKVAIRDLSVLKSVITEYMDTYILFGYNLKGERIIIQHANTPKDRDANMEFLKTIFLKQQHENFLDGEEEDN
jgi:hypothetical protein